MVETLTAQLVGSRYRVGFAVFLVFMSVGSVLTEYTFAAGFFLLVGVAILASVATDIDR